MTSCKDSSGFKKHSFSYSGNIWFEVTFNISSEWTEVIFSVTTVVFKFSIQCQHVVLGSNRGFYWFVFCFQQLVLTLLSGAFRGDLLWGVGGYCWFFFFEKWKRITGSYVGGHSSLKAVGLHRLTPQSDLAPGGTERGKGIGEWRCVERREEMKWKGGLKERK